MFPRQKCKGYFSTDGSSNGKTNVAVIKPMLHLSILRLQENTVSEEDRVCRSCLKTILAYVRFVNKCLDIEAQLNQENEELEKQLEEEDSMEAVQLPDHSDLDNAQIVENIEIVVENGKCFLAQFYSVIQSMCYSEARFFGVDTILFSIRISNFFSQTVLNN